MREYAWESWHKDQETLARHPSWCQSPSLFSLYYNQDVSAHDYLKIAKAGLTFFQMLTATTPHHGNRHFVLSGNVILDLVELGIDIEHELFLVTLWGRALVACVGDSSTGGLVKTYCSR